MKITDWEKRVRALEREGMSRSDAQGAVDAEIRSTITPGTWALSRDAVPAHHVQITVYAESDGQRVATVFLSEANADLIAAAPELLAALRTIAERAVDYPKSEMAHLNAETARAAIAKAEGRA